MRPGGPAASRRWRATRSGRQAALVEDERRRAGDRPAQVDRPVRGGPGLGGGHVRGAGHVVGGQAQPALLVGGERRRRRDRGAAMLAARPTRCAMPRRRTAGTGRPRRRAGLRRGRPNGIRGPRRPGRGSSARRRASAKDSRGARRTAARRSGLLPPGNAKSRRRPIFPKGCPLSIFGAGELNFRVRDGNGCGLSARVTGIYALLDVFGSGRPRRSPRDGRGAPADDLRSRGRQGSDPSDPSH